ncbi:MAG: type II toxin-antitoxin system RelE/ParE family toxin [Bacteroidota bacterium]|nr:type II toxin-antitoxin system RelE/ParE family toxin [Bacteroidota bacterium]
MVITFEDEYLEFLYSGTILKGKPKFSQEVVKKFIKTIDIIKYVENTNKLHEFKGLNFEALKGNLKGKYSVRVDYHYRMIFRIEQDKMIVEEIVVIERLSNHDY